MKLLFVCSYGQIRSVCGSYLFCNQYDVKYLGISNRYTDQYFEEYSEWADYIIVMEDIHIWYYNKFYPQFNSKLANIKVKDKYSDANNLYLKREIYYRVSDFLLKVDKSFKYDKTYPSKIVVYNIKTEDLDDVGFFLCRIEELQKAKKNNIELNKILRKPSSIQ